jgi:hypothetical protein
MPADAQRQSIRWATSNTGSYGYMVGSAMAQVLERALGDDVVVTVQPYPSTTGAMKAAMEGDGEVGYTADVGMRQLYDSRGGIRGLRSRRSAGWFTPGTPIRWKASWPLRPSDRRQLLLLGRFLGQAGVLHPGRLHELAELPAHLRRARLRVQPRRDRPVDPGRRP